MGSLAVKREISRRRINLGLRGIFIKMKPRKENTL